LHLGEFGSTEAAYADQLNVGTRSENRDMIRDGPPTGADDAHTQFAHARSPLRAKNTTVLDL
jgi:hypothetical protein